MNSHRTDPSRITNKFIYTFVRTPFDFLFEIINLYLLRIKTHHHIGVLLLIAKAIENTWGAGVLAKYYDWVIYYVYSHPNTHDIQEE